MGIEICFADAGPLEDAVRFAQAYSAVSPARRQKIDRLCSPSAKRLSLAAGLLLQQALEVAGVDAPAQELAAGEYGKPYLPNRQDVHFSLSHSGARVMCVTADRPVGCDIQETVPRDLRIAERFFSAEEQRRIFLEESDAARQEMFFRIWTLKESFLKCIGLGLTLPLNAFSIIPDDGGVALLQQADSRRYTFLEPDAGAGYHSAVCLREN